MCIKSKALLHDIIFIYEAVAVVLLWQLLTKNSLILDVITEDDCKQVTVNYSLAQNIFIEQGMDYI